MTTTTELTKAKRGTSRICQSCETRFYDLLRESIVCPSCGAPYTIVAPVIAMPRSAGWRGRPFSRPNQAVRAAAPVQIPSSEPTASEPTADEPIADEVGNLDPIEVIGEAGSEESEIAVVDDDSVLDPDTLGEGC